MPRREVTRIGYGKGGPVFEVKEGGKVTVQPVVVATAIREKMLLVEGHAVGIKAVQGVLSVWGPRVISIGSKRDGSMRALADSVGVSVAYLSSVKNSERRISPKVFLLIAGRILDGEK
jgi:methylmalonyl-CoA mutase cobalamin-binding subunit